MNVLKQGLNRAQQSIHEKVGGAEKTELDPELQKQLTKADTFKVHIEKVLSALESYIQPDPAQRMLTGLMEEKSNKEEAVGEEMSALATKLDQDDPFGAVMQRGATAFNQLGKEKRRMLKEAESRSLAAMRKFLKDDVKAINDLRKSLENLRLDMDALKGKLGKSSDAAAVELASKFEAAKKAYEEKVSEVRGLVKNLLEVRVPELQAAYRELSEVLLESSQKNVEIIKELKKHLDLETPESLVEMFRNKIKSMQQPQQEKK